MRKYLVITWAILALARPVSAQQPFVVNGVVARVNDRVITYKEVMTQLAGDEAFLMRTYANQPQVLAQELNKLRAATIDLLVENELILAEYNKAGFNLPESVIDQRINREIHESYGDQMTLRKTLREQGLTMEAYRKQAREKTIINEMVRFHVPRDPVISPYRIESYYEEHKDDFQLPDRVKVRIITLLVRPGDVIESKRKLAAEIMAKLEEGVPFEEMAKIYSQDTRAAEGGDRGWIDRTMLRAELADKAFSLGVGEHSGVVETDTAFYVLQVDEVQSAHVRPLADVRGVIERELKAQEVNRRHAKWIKRLKDKSFVRYYLE